MAGTINQNLRRFLSGGHLLDDNEGGKALQKIIPRLINTLYLVGWAAPGGHVDNSHA